MKKTIGMIGGLLILIVLLYFGFQSFSNNLVGGGGSQQYAPDIVLVGEPAVVTFIVTATGGGGDIKGRFKDINFHYRLVGENAYGVIQPQAIALPNNFQLVQSGSFQSEAYTFTIPPYPDNVTGEIEYYIELAFDGNKSRQEGVKRIRLTSSPSMKTNPLGEPNATLAYDNVVYLLLPMRECDNTYIIERSYNMIDWQVVGTTTFATYQEPYDHNFKACENSFVDRNVATGTKKLWYRYGLLDAESDMPFWSNIGEVIMEEY